MFTPRIQLASSLISFKPRPTEAYFLPCFSRSTDNFLTFHSFSYVFCIYGSLSPAPSLLEYKPLWGRALFKLCLPMYLMGWNSTWHVVGAQ